jgi:uncharacterized repeat protein (TIGR03803 family)
MRHGNRIHTSITSKIRSALHLVVIFPIILSAMASAVWGQATLKTPVSFDGDNGSGLMAGVIADPAGDLFGTTFFGGSDGDGTVYEIPAGTNQVTTLANFEGRSNGQYPMGSLFADPSGDLYGTTSAGGANNLGTLFEISAGSHSFTTLVTFNGNNGAVPEGGLIADSSGNLYGTAAGGGGPSNAGIVFELTANTHLLTTVASFDRTTNAYAPIDNLMTDSSGNIFGATQYGGSTTSNAGSVFEVAAETNTATTIAVCISLVSDGIRWALMG